MPIRPADSVDLATRLRTMYVDAESLVLQQIARAIARDGEVPDHLNARLDNQRRMVRELDRILRDLNKGLPGAVRRLVAMGYNRGVGFAVADMEKAGITGKLAVGVGLFGEVRDTGTELVLARAAIGDLEAMSLQVRRWCLDLYAKVGLVAAQEVASGAITRREASARLLTKLAGQGVRGFTDRSGRRWEMGSYAEMVGRTTVAQASLEGHSERLQAYGVDTVIVSNAPEECKVCRPFEGKVLSLSGNTNGTLPDGRRVLMSLAQAKREGLYHPNCRHSHSIYLPGVTKGPGRDTADPEGDRLRQQQRAYERRIRELKRRKVVADEFGGPQAVAAGKALRDKQAEFKAWRDENDRKNLSYRTNLRTR